MRRAPEVRSRRQHLRLWFEFLRLCHRIDELQDALKRSEKFYAPWGDIRTQRFDDWWSSHAHLFGETAVQVVDRAEPHPNVIHLAVPLNLPFSKTLAQIQRIVLEEQQRRLETAREDPISRKTRSIGSGQFELTAGVELRGQTLNEVLIIFSIWIDLNRPAVNAEFCLEVLKCLKARKRSNWIPYLLTNPPQRDKNGNLRFGEDQIRQIRRYLKRGMEVCRSVSLGEFPGRSRLG